MRKLGWVLWLGVLALAVTAEDVLKAAEDYLKAAPWQAVAVGKIRLPSGELADAQMKVYVIPGKEIARIEFEAPDAVADNFVILTPKKVYNYLFLTNQVVIYPRERARIEGLGFNLAQVGNLKELAGRKDLAWRLAGEETLDGKAALHLVGTPADPDDAGFARVELWILKEPPRPYRFRVEDAEGELLVELTWKAFKRTPLNPETLLAYPPDAEVIEK